MLTTCIMLVFCFFFQAEDGIRDIGVTGVQTCALPISPTTFAQNDILRQRPWATWFHDSQICPIAFSDISTLLYAKQRGRMMAHQRNKLFYRKIGRASCRERV